MSSGWPDKIEVKSIELEHTTKPLPFDRRELYGHLRALCDYDASFLIHRPELDDDLEKLTVLDAHAIRRACTAREATIGTVQLLPEGGSIALKLAARDAPFYAEHPNRGKFLFRTFIWRVNRHFDELTRQQVQMEPPMATGEGTGEKRGPKVGTLDRVREAHRLIKAGWAVTRACEQARTDSRTYYQWCRKATGGEPIVPYKDT